MQSKNSLNESILSSPIQMGKCRATDKKRTFHFTFGRQLLANLLNQPLFFFGAEHFRIRIDEESVHPLILTFGPSRINLAPKNIEMKTGCSQMLYDCKNSTYFSTIQNVSVVAGSARIRLSRIRFFSTKNH